MVSRELWCLGLVRLELGDVLFDSAVVIISEKDLKTAHDLLQDVWQVEVETGRSLFISVGRPDYGSPQVRHCRSCVNESNVLKYLLQAAAVCSGG